MWEWRTHVRIVFLLYLLCVPRVLFAASDHLLISEVQITGGTGATDHDFVELYNPTNQPIDLNGYRLVKRTATGTSDTTIKSWTSSTIVPAQGYFLWANTTTSFSGVTPNETSSATLADNNSLALRLGDANTGTIIDSVGWGSATGVFVQGSVFPTNPGAKQSLERTVGVDTRNNAADFSLQQNPNPTSTSSGQSDATQTPTGVSPPTTSTPSIPMGLLMINEVFSAPSQGSEWVEIFNASSQNIHLTGVILEDGAGPILTLTGSISAGSLMVFDLVSAKLNNDGDRVRLLSNGIEIDAVSYGKWDDGNTADNASSVKTNQSVARKSATNTANNAQDFAVTEEPTKGLPNVIVQREVTTISRTVRAPKTIPTAVMRINELMIDPGDNDVEWVEIYNAGETSVDLTLWTLEDGSGIKTKLSGTWIPGQYYVVKDILGALNNSGDLVILRDEKGEVHDRVSYGSWDDGNRVDNALTISDPMSLGRRADGYDTGVDSKDFITLIPTKGTSNAKGAPADAVTIPDGAVVISEIHPTGSLPFVELFNTTDSYLRLTGWFLKDNDGITTDVSHVLIAPHAYFAVALGEDSLQSKGYVSLYDQKRHQKDKVMYRDSTREKSYAAVASDWVWTTPTPDRENVMVPVVVAPLPPEPAPPAVLIASAKTAPKKSPPPATTKIAAKPATTTTLTPLSLITEKLLGRAVRATGIVSEKRGNIIVIKDADHTLRVSLASVNYGGQKVTANIGDTMTATGILKKSNAGMRIVPWQVSHITVTKPPPPAPKPKPVVLEAIPEPEPTPIPWSAISVAMGSIAASVVIKKGIPIKKAKDYAALLVRRVKRSRGDDTPLPGA